MQHLNIDLKDELLLFTAISNIKTHEKTSVEIYIYICTLTYIINSSVFMNKIYTIVDEGKVFLTHLH